MPEHLRGAVRQSLTPRELEVLQLMRDGLTNTEIAARLGITRATVKNHITAICLKLRVRGRVGAVVRGLQDGLIALPRVE